jgi:hypothetical protein
MRINDGPPHPTPPLDTVFHPQLLLDLNLDFKIPTNYDVVKTFFSFHFRIIELFHRKIKRITMGAAKMLLGVAKVEMVVAKI